MDFSQVCPLTLCTIYIYSLFLKVLKRFLDVDHLISLLVQLPKNETVKSAENKISLVIYLKHCLELVEPLRAAISTSQNPLLSTFHEVIILTSTLH